jgi:fatty-acyl-CoA synthase
MDLSIWQIFEPIAAALADRDAVIDRERRFTYGQLADRAVRLANVLAGHGLGCHRERAGLRPWELGQDTLALLMFNCAEYVEGLLGASGARVTPMNVNYSYTAEEVSYVLNDSGAKAVLYHARLAPVLAAALPRLRVRPLLLQVRDGSGEALLPGAVDYESALAAAAPSLVTTGHSGDDILIIYTGGTTGMPKAVLWRQADAWTAGLARGMHAGTDATVADLVGYVRARHAGRVLVVVPMMHGSGTFQALGGLLYGDTVRYVGEGGHFRADEVLATIGRERVTSMVMIGDAYAKPLLAELETGRYDTSSLRLVLSGGAPLSHRSKQALVQALRPAAFIELMGASETGTALSREHTGDGAEDQTSGVFRPQAGVTVLDTSRSFVHRPGHAEPGYFAKAGAVPLGYLGDQAKTAATFTTVDGVRYSVPGDLALLRTDGLVEILGRDSATINTGGEKVFAEEVEEALTTHPAVRDAAVAGRPSERWGQEVTAIVELVDGSEVTDEEIRATAATLIARYKLPKLIIRVDRVRRTANGKIDRPWAKQVAAESRS